MKAAAGMANPVLRAGARANNSASAHNRTPRRLLACLSRPIIRNLFAYRRGHLNQGGVLADLRIPLGQLWNLTREALDDGEWATFADNVRFGAAVDLVVQLTRRRLGVPERA